MKEKQNKKQPARLGRERSLEREAVQQPIKLTTGQQTMKPPSPSAVKAATLIQEEIKDARKRTGFVDVIPGTDEIGVIIDRCMARPVDPDMDCVPQVHAWSVELLRERFLAMYRNYSEEVTENRKLRQAAKAEDPDGNPYAITPESELEAIKQSLEP